MPLDLDKVLQGVDINPSIPPPSASPEPAVKGPVETSGRGFVMRKGGQALGEQIGRNVEAVVAATAGESLPKAALRAFLPREWVDKYVPDLIGGPFDLSSLLPGRGKESKAAVAKALDAVEKTAASPENLGDIGAQTASNVHNFFAKGERALLPKGMQFLSPDAPDRPDIGPAPGPISKNLGTVSAFGGQALGLPFSSVKNLPMYLVSAMGAGEGSDLLGNLAKYGARAVGASPETQQAAEVGGELVGAPIGSMANVLRAKALTLPFSKAADAWKIAADAKRAGDERGLLSIFADKFSNLKDDSKTVLQKTVNETVANDIRKDPQATIVTGYDDKGQPVYGPGQKLQDFNDAVAKTGMDPNKFTIAEQTSTPSLVASQRDLRPKTPEESQLISTHKQEQQQALMDAGKRITQNGVDTDAKKLPGAVEEFRKLEELRLKGLNQEADSVAATTPALSVNERVQQGDTVRQLAEQAKAEARNEKNALYETRNTLSDQMGVKFDLTPAVKEAKDVIRSAMATLNTGTAPESIRNLETLLKRGKGADATLDDILNGKLSNDGIPMRDLGDALNLVNDDLHAATKGTDVASRAQASNLARIQQALEQVLQGQAPPEVIAAHNAAVENFKNRYVPRFLEGANANIFREGTTANLGREKVLSESLIPSYLEPAKGTGQVSETSMREFDNLFGGKIEGTKPIPEAYNELWRTLEDRYAQEVLKGGTEKFTGQRHEEFLNKYEAPLNRLPALSDKLNANAAKITDLQAEGERVKEQFKTIFDSPLTRTFGPQEAEKVMAAALKDPRRMGQLISALNKGEAAAEGQGTKTLLKEIAYRAMPWRETAGGSVEYDPKRLQALLDAGRGPDGSIGGLQVAFRAAFGRAEGDAHMERLRALATLAERADSTNPRFLRPQELLPEDLLKQGTGQTLGSWLTDLKAFGSGRISPAYLLGTQAGRFFNVRLKAALNEAQINAIFDPETSKAILNLATTQADKPAAYGALSKVIGSSWTEGKEFMKQLVDSGSVKKHMFNAERLTITNRANEDENAPSQREQGFSEPAINRIRQGGQ